MDFAITSVALPLFVSERQTLLRPFQKFQVSGIAGERQCRITVVTKATGESFESSTSLSIIGSVQNIWDKSEDRVAVIGLGFAAIVALWTSANLVTAIDKLPLIPNVLELIDILFSSVSFVIYVGQIWIVYRYLLFKPDRGCDFFRPPQAYRRAGQSLAQL